MKNTLTIDIAVPRARSRLRYLSGKREVELIGTITRRNLTGSAEDLDPLPLA